MRHRQRHLPYAVSTVLGLAAPALAALLLTSSTPGLAAVPAPAAPGTGVVAESFEHGIHPVAAAPPAVHKPVVKPVVRIAAPRAVRRTTTIRPAVRRTVVRAATTTTRTTTVKRTTSQTAQPSGTDDYPYRTAVGDPTDRWGFTERQCVSFAAWRLAQHGHAITNNDNWGSALTWDDTAKRLGYTVTRTAHVGAVAQWNADESSPYYAPGSATANGHFVAGGYGHVGWVKMVYSDGSALVEQYNMGNSRSYSVMRVKAPRYLLVG